MDFKEKVNQNIEAIKIINDFVYSEYMTTLQTEDLTDLKKIPLACTEYLKEDTGEAKEDIVITVYTNIINYSITTYYNDIEVSKEEYKTYEEYKEVLECLYFDSLVALEELEEYINIKKGSVKND